MTSSSSLRRGMVAFVVGTAAVLSSCSVPGLVNRNTAPSASPTGTGTPTQTPTRPPPTTGVVQGSDGWSTYTNADLGISFRFPTTMRVSDGAPCTKLQYANGYTYQAAEGVVPSALIKDGDTFYVAQKYGYQPTDATGRAPAQTYRSCTKVVTTKRILHQYRTTQHHTTGPYHFLAITVARASTKTQVAEYLGATFAGCPSLKLNGMAINTSGPWRDVKFSCPRDPSYFVGLGTPTYITNYSQTRFYSEQGLLVMLWFTQVDQIYLRKEAVSVIGMSKAEAKVGDSFTLVG